MLLTDPIEKSRVRLLEERYVEGAGFANRPGGNCRPDSTAWAILVLEAAGGENGAAAKARRWLASVQFGDGRVCITPQLTDACWPTALAILAWQGAPDCEEPRSRAIRFLLDFRQAEMARVTMRRSRAGRGLRKRMLGWSRRRMPLWPCGSAGMLLIAVHRMRFDC